MWTSDKPFGELYVHIIFHVLVTPSLGGFLTITELHISSYKMRYIYQILTAILTFGQESIEQFCLVLIRSVLYGYMTLKVISINSYGWATVLKFGKYIYLWERNLLNLSLQLVGKSLLHCHAILINLHMSQILIIFSSF